MNCDDIHGELNITFKELLLSVYDFIIRNDNKIELLKILNIEIQDSICKCFTGRLSRLINCLNGFDENIKIEISSNEQIGNIIILIKSQLENTNEYTEEKHKELVIIALKERDYSDNIINEWISYI